MNKILSSARSIFQGLAMAISAMLISLSAMAQDKQVDVDISTDKGGNDFWGSPWVWVIGAAIFILLLVAILRGGSRKD